MNPIVVHKYGGSSLSDLDKVRSVAQRIYDTVQDGKRVVAVVSAMGGTTDNLLSQAKTLTQVPNPRELDMLLSVGERISTALLSIAICDLGLSAVSFTGSQSGIITNTRHNRARIIEIRPYRLMDALDVGNVVIVAGYQGVSYAREITTLGRGGTDTTAVALAAALDAEYCEICSDVDGVYTADPRVVPNATRLEALSHDEMLALSRHGSRVLNQDCVTYASQAGIALFAKSTFGPRDDKGTVIRMNPPGETRAVTALAHRDEIAVLSGGQDVDLDRVLEVTSALGALPESVECAASAQRFSMSLALEDIHNMARLRERLTEVFGDRVTVDEAHGSISVVGRGLADDPTLLRQVLRLGRQESGDSVGVKLAPLSITLTLKREAVAQTVRRLHAALFESA